LCWESPVRRSARARRRPSSRPPFADSTEPTSPSVNPRTGSERQHLSSKSSSVPGSPVVTAGSTQRTKPNCLLQRRLREEWARSWAATAHRHGLQHSWDWILDDTYGVVPAVTAVVQQTAVKSRINHRCDRCKTPLFCSDPLDAWWCPRCDRWAESTCGDAACSACAARPLRPSMMLRQHESVLPRPAVKRVIR